MRLTLRVLIEEHTGKCAIRVGRIHNISHYSVLYENVIAMETHRVKEICSLVVA